MLCSNDHSSWLSVQSLTDLHLWNGKKLSFLHFSLTHTEFSLNWVPEFSLFVKPDASLHLNICHHPAVSFCPLRREEGGRTVGGRDGRDGVQRGGEGRKEEEEERGRGGEPVISRQNPAIHCQTVWIQRPEPGSSWTEGLCRCSVLQVLGDVVTDQCCFQVSILIFLLQEVPDELWELLELEKLNLSLNSLKVLPPQLALLSNLVVLNLWGNQVSSFYIFIFFPSRAVLKTSEKVSVCEDQQPRENWRCLIFLVLCVYWAVRFSLGLKV